MTTSIHDVESEILRLSTLLEDSTEEFAKLAREAAEAEHAYKRSYYSHFLNASGTEKARVAVAETNADRQRAASKIADAVRDACQEKCRSLRSQLSALQTISANTRAAGG